MDISERIKARRLELGLTLEDVALKLGVAKSTILRYETKDIGNMGIDKIELLAKALKCTPAYLMGWELEKTDEGYALKSEGDELRIILDNTVSELSTEDLKKVLDFARFIESQNK